MTFTVRRAGAATVSVLAAFTAVACSSAPASITPAPSPSSTRTSLSPYNPCTDVSDDIIRTIGFRPGSRTFLTLGANESAACTFDSSESQLRLSASSTTFEYIRDNNGSRTIGVNINERPAVIVRGRTKTAPCLLAMKSTGGTVQLSSSLNVAALEWGMNPCARLQTLATAIEPTIGDG